ncbi:hypothetical protein C8R44DRAFT_25709 [Mycena epipterygia]|nr:hypothetical protein C8R44DRAFT_25709 [Mycena epipterygia]
MTGLGLYFPSHGYPTPRRDRKLTTSAVATRTITTKTVKSTHSFWLLARHPCPVRGFPSLFVKCMSSLRISITNDRRLGFLSKAKLIYVAVEYRPRTSPTPCFLSAIKTMPE